MNEKLIKEGEPARSSLPMAQPSPCEPATAGG
jgi:hypothetical protein